MTCKACGISTYDRTLLTRALREQIKHLERLYEDNRCPGRSMTGRSVEKVLAMVNRSRELLQVFDDQDTGG